MAKTIELTPPKRRAPRPRSTELLTMAAIERGMDDLPEEVRARIAEWVVRRYCRAVSNGQSHAGTLGGTP